MATLSRWKRWRHCRAGSGGDTVALEAANTNFLRSLLSLQVRNASESKLRVTDSIGETDGAAEVITVTHSNLTQSMTTMIGLICSIIGQLPSAGNAGWTQKFRLYVKVEKPPKYSALTSCAHYLNWFASENFNATTFSGINPLRTEINFSYIKTVRTAQ